MARKFKKREKLFLLAGGGAVVLFVLVRWMLMPLFQFASGAGERIEEQTGMLTALQGVAAREPGLREEERALEEALEGYRPYLLEGETPSLAGATLETRLKEMAAVAGLNIVSGKPLKHVQKGSYVEIPLQIVATGSIENLRDFILSVENSGVFIGIGQFNLRTMRARRAQSAESTEIQATMTVSGLMAAPPPGEGA